MSEKEEARDHFGPTHSLSQVIFLFRVPQLVLRRAIQDSDGLEVTAKQKISRIVREEEWNTHDAKDGIPLAAVLDGLIDDSVFGRDLVGASFCEVRHPGVIVAEVYLRDALVEKNFGRIEFEFKSQLFVIAVDKRTSAIEYTPGTRTPGNKCRRAEDAQAAESASVPRLGTHMAWFPLKYNSESSKSLKARSNRSNRKLETPHWK